MKKYAMFYAVLFTFACVAIVPASTHAAPAPNAFLGGGNALMRATSGQSQGLTHATSTSDLLSHLTLASTRGGRGTEVPPENSNEGGNAEGTEEGEQGTQSLPEEANENGTNHENGGAQGGEGGNGDNSSPGGLVRAGSVVSNSNAVNVINTNIVRISTR